MKCGRRVTWVMAEDVQLEKLKIDIENRTKNNTLKMLKGPTKHEDTKKTDKVILGFTDTKLETTQVEAETSQTKDVSVTKYDGGKNKTETNNSVIDLSHENERLLDLA